MAKARIEDLEALYRTLESSMTQADTIITEVDNKFTAASNEWQSRGREKFEQDWGTFKQSLIKMCQAFAEAGGSVAQQHNDFARGAQEADQHPVLPPLTSPR